MQPPYTDIVNAFRSKKILVIGDLMLDVFLKGTSTRLSPEAPVPVVDVEGKTALPGGSANTACNLRSLGAEVSYCSVAGLDEDGEEAIRLLKQSEVDIAGVMRDSSRKTIVKTRLLAGTQVITRFDQGTTSLVGNTISQKLDRFLEKNGNDFDAIVVSDYNKGVITPLLLETLKRLKERNSVFVAVDSKRLSFFKGLKPSMIKPNYDEAIDLLQTKRLSSGRPDQILSAARALYEKTQARIIAVTLDEEGSIVFEKEKSFYRCQPLTVPPYGVAGAGDTYLSAFTLSYLVCNDITLSADIATAAASAVIRKEATSQCTFMELKNFFHTRSKYVCSTDELRDLCETYRLQGKHIVFTNGCFDILHSGHVSYLHHAKTLGDILIVGMNTDESIRRLKGPNRPINNFNDRLQVLSALGSVDHIVPFGTEGNDTPIPLIEVVQPHVFVKGGDYTRDQLPEADTVERLGGEVLLLPHIPPYSTTAIIERIAANETPGRKL